MTDFALDEDDVDLRIENFLRAINPRQLLVNVCGPCFERTENRQYRIGLGGGYTERYAQPHAEAPAWPQLQKQFEQDARVQAAVAEASKLGLRGRFGGDASHNLDVFQYIFDIADDACKLIRERVFQNKAWFPGEEQSWQQKFDLYLKQEWTRDDKEREYYRKNFDLVAWPSPPRELWPIRRDA